MNITIYGKSDCDDCIAAFNRLSELVGAENVAWRDASRYIYGKDEHGNVRDAYELEREGIVDRYVEFMNVCAQELPLVQVDGRYMTATDAERAVQRG